MNAKARQRAEVIFKVRSGQMTATDAAHALGISRQQYYQWEQRALQALLQHRQRTMTAKGLTSRLEQINRVANPSSTPAKTE